MSNLTRIAHKLDPKAKTCRVIIETPKGRRSKFDYDSKHRAFRLKSLLPDGMSFPMDFGFVPSTVAGDGDPLDVMVLGDEPTPVGALLDVRLLGAIEAEEVEKGAKERNDRLLAVATVSRLYAKILTVYDLDDGFTKDLVRFWEDKADLEGKTFTCLGVVGPDKAVDLITKCAAAAKSGAKH